MPIVCKNRLDAKFCCFKTFCLTLRLQEGQRLAKFVCLILVSSSTVAPFEPLTVRGLLRIGHTLTFVERCLLTFSLQQYPSFFTMFDYFVQSLDGSLEHLSHSIQYKNGL